ncbi:MAG: AIR synthase-related protein, partial [Pseudomonadota bacterium]
GRTPVDGSRVEVGDAVLALHSVGFRSNGFSLARRILQRQFGERWHEEILHEGERAGQALLTPCRIYCRGVCEALEQGIDLRGIAHITGGGIPHKFRRVLRLRGLGAMLDALPAPAPAMARVQALGGVPARQAYTLWNMGTGMLLVLPPAQVDDALALLAAQGLPGQRAGEIVAEPAIVLEARGAESGRLEFLDGA